MNTKTIGTIAFAFASLLSVPAFAQNPFFSPGNVIVAVEGCGVHAGTCVGVPSGTGIGTLNSTAGGYGDNQGAALTLFQYQPNGTTSVMFVNSLALPRNASGANFPVSSEYGSSSEGTLQLSGTGQYLTIMGYGINAQKFDASYPPGFTADPYGAAPSGALAQSGSLTGQSYTPIPRVAALIDANGNVNSSTGVYNIFNTNNPRSIFTVNGTTAWLSGQGSGADSTGGVFYTALGAVNDTPTRITGLDTTSKTIAQDTRTVQVYNNTLYVSVDSKEGSGSNRDFIGTLGTPPSTSLYNSNGGPAQLSGFATSGAGKLTITSGPNSNGNNLNAGLAINLSPVNYFFASPSILYVTDGGNPKNDSNGDTNSTGTANIGNGGLEKWINSSANGTGSWSLAYTLYSGLNLVNNGSASGTSGLYGIAGVVNGGTAQLYVTNYTLNDLDKTFLYGITDTLSFTLASQAAAEMFTLLDTAPPDSNFKGVSFAPTLPAGGVEITTSPSGLTFTSSGTGCAPGTYTAPQTLLWTPGSSCTLTTPTPQADASALGGTVYFAQWENGSTSASRIITAPSSVATYTAIFTTGMLPSTSVFIADGGRVKKFDGTGAYSSQFSITGGGLFPIGAAGMAIDSNNNFFLTDIANKNVSEFSSNGTFVRTFGSYGSGNGQFLNGIGGVAIDANGNVWVVDAGNDRVQEFNNTGLYLGQFGTSGKGNGQFQGPSAMVIDTLGNIWVADGTRVQEFSNSGVYESQFPINGAGRFPNGVGGMTIDPNGNFFLTDIGNKNISEFNSSGSFLRSFGSYGVNNGQFLNGINGIASDISGNLFVSDAGNYRVQEFFNPGVFENLLGGQFQSPGPIAVLQNAVVVPE